MLNMQFGSALTSLNTSAGPAGMNLLGYRLHRLIGDRQNQRAVSVSGGERPDCEVLSTVIPFVAPAEAGAHASTAHALERWIPAFAGMTRVKWDTAV